VEWINLLGDFVGWTEEGSSGVGFTFGKEGGLGELVWRVDLSC
jgi:hypothetical protein